MILGDNFFQKLNYINVNFEIYNRYFINNDYFWFNEYIMDTGKNR